MLRWHWRWRWASWHRLHRRGRRRRRRASGRSWRQPRQGHGILSRDGVGVGARAFALSSSIGPVAGAYGGKELVDFMRRPRCTATAASTAPAVTTTATATAIVRIVAGASCTADIVPVGVNGIPIPFSANVHLDVCGTLSTVSTRLPLALLPGVEDGQLQSSEMWLAEDRGLEVHRPLEQHSRDGLTSCGQNAIKIILIHVCIQN